MGVSGAKQVCIEPFCDLHSEDHVARVTVLTDCLEKHSSKMHFVKLYPSLRKNLFVIDAWIVDEVFLTKKKQNCTFPVFYINKIDISIYQQDAPIVDEWI